MKANRWRAHTKQDLIIEVWEDLDCESVGAQELAQIQQAVSESFGEGALESPAAIARTLADEGAVLRHPEVLEFDTQWREQNLTALILPDELNFSDLVESSKSITKLDELRQRLEGEGDQVRLRRLRELALSIKGESQRLAQSKIVGEKNRVEAGEIAQWLTVWLQEPNMFEDWLSLRRRSPEFIQLLEKRDWGKTIH
ncbi:MAG: hypothetical protein ACR2G5_01680 [Pyrinomonadaceae bacterium]